MELSDLHGFGPARIRALNAKDIYTTEDLLEWLPSGYCDTTTVLSPANMLPGVTACFEGFIKGNSTSAFVKGRQWVNAVVSDECGQIRCIWFNQPWMKGKLFPNQHVVLYGTCVKKKNGTYVINPSFEEPGVIRPVYRNIPGIGQKLLRDTIRLLLESSEPEDPIPSAIRSEYRLISRREALAEIHFPQNAEKLAQAKWRMAFEELLLFQTAVSGSTAGHAVSSPIRISAEEEAAFWRQIPYEPTGAQKRVASEIRADMGREKQMTRLVQGDVGSGKTMLAFYALYCCAVNGGQGALMAPTEILAQQHLKSAQELFGRLGIRCGLITGRMTAAERRRAEEAIAEGEWQIVIGTHALISDPVCYHNLQLVVTDEQHRFGVKQRTKLQNKGSNPHILVMSATPIPRTLSLILYGDLDISVVDELPPGHGCITTRLVPEKKRSAMYQFIREEAARGRQAYVVCPLVGDEDAEEDVPSAEKMKKQLEQELSPLRIGLVHGKLDKQTKEDTISAFCEGQMDVLVATTVIEVGVNVPNATIMIIESADRFGLAQLHQLRGRVGRGKEKSWCFLMAEPNERLRIIQDTTDGFRIAEKDLELRGAGEIFGTRQHGAPELPALMLASDPRLFQQTREAYQKVFESPVRSSDAAKLAGKAFERYGKNLAETGFN